MTTLAQSFPPDYGTARRRFRSAAEAARARLETFPIAREVSGSDLLVIDVARIGDGRPSNVVVVSSGLHGVEAPLGSAVQTALIRRAAGGWAPPPGVAIVLAHVLDPFGFAATRRVNEDNVDLNRNFLVNGEPYRGGPSLYADLDGWLNPSRPPRRYNGFLPRALLAILKHGMPALKDAIAGGQYDFPAGLFFGGRAPSATRRVLAENLPRWVGGAGHVVHVDFHTGLGRWASHKLLIDDEMTGQADRLRRVFGDETIEVSEPNGTAYHARGGLGPWCQTELFPDRPYDFVCAEFGTYRPLAVLGALRAENQAHHWGEPGGAASRRAKRRLAETFTPADSSWRATTAAAGIEIVLRAAEACAGAGVTVR